MTWSNTAGVDAPIDKFSGTPSFDKKVLMRTAKAEGDALDEPPASDAVEPAATATGSTTDETAALEALPSSEETVETTATAVADVPSESAIELRPSIAAQSIPLNAQNIPLPPIAKPVVQHSRDEICDTVSKSAQTNALPIAYLVRLLFQESGFDAASVSRTGAQGIAQFMPETAATEGLKNPFDPLQAIPASARLLRKLFDQFGNLGLAAAAYNAGPKRIHDWLAKKGKLPQETEGYVRIVTGRPAETWRVASASGTALTVPNRAPCKSVVPPPLPPVANRTIVAKAPAHPHGMVKIQIAAANPAKRVKPVKQVKATKTAASHHTVPTEQLAAAAHKHSPKRVHVAQR
jgi:hypothetical protein